MTQIALVLVFIGRVVFYAPAYGDMAGIAGSYGLAIPADHVGVAHYDQAHMGWTGELDVNGRSYLVVVVDYTHPADLDLVRGIIAEVPHTVAVEAGFALDGWAQGRLSLRPPLHSWN